MTDQDILGITQELLVEISSNAPPEKIAQKFSEGVLFEVQGDVGSLPWIGRQNGRDAVMDFVSGLRSQVTQKKATVDDILANNQRSVVLGSLSSIINSTGRLIECDFAFIFSFEKGEIVRFQMLEDSFAVSRAARA